MPAINVVLQETYPGTLTVIPGGQTIDTNISESYQTDLEILQSGTTLETVLGPIIRGEKGDNGGVEIPFAWGDATPKILVETTGGKLVYNVQIHLEIPFDGTGCSLSVGDLVDTDRLMTTDQVDPTTAGSYSTSPNYRYVSDTDLYLTIVPGSGNTTGSGLVKIFIEQ